MATLMHSGAARALLLAMLWAAGAGADDDVTTQRCHGFGRVRHYPTDYAATWLWLTNCNLIEINPDDVKGLPNLKLIGLSRNSIKNIHPASFHNFPKLYNIDLDHNKLEEVTVEMFSKNKLTFLSLNNNEITSLPPNFVSRLNRAGASLTQFYFHSNPWHCSCLIETLADVKRAGVTQYKKNPYYSNEIIYHYDGARAECVFHGAVPCGFRPGMLPPAH